MTKQLSDAALHRFRLVAELFLFFALIAFFYFVHTSRWGVILTLWAITFYALLVLKQEKDFSWRKMWNGNGWPKTQMTMAIVRFMIALPIIISFTLYIAPHRLFSFPLERTGLWALVMVLYPILSVIPQEAVFRSFFFHRYGPLLKQRWMLIALSALSFGFIHIVFHNWVAPIFSTIGGLFFASSYSQHRSLKWVVIEHAAYGCAVFTIGIGFYFVFSAIPPAIAR